MTAPKVAVARWHTVPVESLKYYWQRLRDAGLEPVDLGQEASLDQCSGLVLTGGVDIDPSLYGEARHPRAQDPDRERDEFELTHLRRALERDMPVLALCRGHQLLNVCMGGRLLQHIEAGGHETHEDRSSSWHDIGIVPGTRLHGILHFDSLRVNSRHHQAVIEATLAPGLRITATTVDDLVEGVESERHTWVIGVQWHPEREEREVPEFSPQSARLFQSLAAATQPTSVPRR